MKGVISLIVLAAVLMIGCQDDNSILEPTNDFSDSTPLNKGRIIQPRLDDEGDRDLDDFFLDDSLAFGGNVKSDVDSENRDNIGIENDKANDAFMTKYSKTLTIKGEKGGRVSVFHIWKNSNGDDVEVRAQLKIPAGAYKGELTFDMIFDYRTLSMELCPSPFIFDKPVDFTMIFENIDLSGYDENYFKFTYMDGEEQIKYRAIEIDIENGALEVIGAKLHHFSRYGWTRKKESPKDEIIIFDEI